MQEEMTSTGSSLFQSPQTHQIPPNYFYTPYNNQRRFQIMTTIYEELTPLRTEPHQVFIAILDSIPMGSNTSNSNKEREAKLCRLINMTNPDDNRDTTMTVLGYEFLYGMNQALGIKGYQEVDKHHIICPCQAESILNPNGHTHLNWTPEQTTSAHRIQFILTGLVTGIVQYPRSYIVYL